MRKTVAYWAWVLEEAKKINSDGCTAVTQLRQSCCYEHDLAYYYGKDPRKAYKLYEETDRKETPWDNVDKITKAEADKRFAECCGRLISIWRYPGVVIGGWFGWLKHRAQR